MTTNYSFFADLLKEIPDILADSILSRTIYSDDQIKVILFGFAAGQELSEHTASVPAIIHILSGKAGLTLGTDAFEAGPGTWARLPANLSHSVYAHESTTMLLLMLRNNA